MKKASKKLSNVQVVRPRLLHFHQSFETLLSPKVWLAI